MNSDLIKRDWHSSGYSFGVFRDPPGQVWADFVHKTDELVVFAEGEIEVVIEVKAQIVGTHVGMDRVAAQEAFSGFLSDRSLNTSQIRFIDQVFDLYDGSEFTF